MPTPRALEADFDSMIGQDGYTQEDADRQRRQGFPKPLRVWHLSHAEVAAHNENGTLPDGDIRFTDCGCGKNHSNMNECVNHIPMSKRL